MGHSFNKSGARPGGIICAVPEYFNVKPERSDTDKNNGLKESPRIMALIFEDGRFLLFPTEVEGGSVDSPLPKLIESHITQAYQLSIPLAA